MEVWGRSPQENLVKITVFSNTTKPPRGENRGSVEPLIYVNFGKIFLGAPPPDPRTYLQSDFSYDILRGKNQKFSHVTPYEK